MKKRNLAVDLAAGVITLMLACVGAIGGYGTAWAEEGPSVTAKVFSSDGFVGLTAVNEGDTVLTCTMSISGDDNLTAASNVVLQPQGGTWSSRTIETLKVGSYVFHVDCGSAKASKAFTVGGSQPTTTPTPPTPSPSPTKTPTKKPTPSVTPTASPSASSTPTPSETVTPPVLKGKLIVETSCEQVSIDVRDVPDGVSYQVKLDGKAVSYDEGAIKVAPGAHVITLVVGGKVVDTVKVAIEACAPEATKVTLKVQVDKYSTKTKKLRSKAAGYDNDRKLKKGEDRPHYGKSVWEIVTVTGTTATTKAQWIAKINKATKKVPNLKGGKKWTAVAIKKAKAKSITVAWIIKGDGKPTAWHKGYTKTNVPQRHFASNR